LNGGAAENAEVSPKSRILLIAAAKALQIALQLRCIVL